MIPDNVVEEAKNANIVDFIIRYYGFSFKESYGSYRCKQHPSLAIASDCKSWAWHSQDLFGHGAISFVMKVEGLSFPRAVEEIMGYSACHAPIYKEPEPPKVLQLPERGQNCKKIWYYLCNVRCLDPSIVDQLIVSERIYQDIRNNVVFVGVDG
ncbi:MAG: DUF3991 domain-containing protein [Eubacteriales bacterium]